MDKPGGDGVLLALNRHGKHKKVVIDDQEIDSAIKELFALFSTCQIRYISNSIGFKL